MNVSQNKIEHMNNQNSFKKVASFGDEYRKIHLSDKYDKNNVKDDWWEALLFFLGRIYFQGRKDVISFKVYERVIKVLNELFPKKNRINAFEELKKSDWVLVKENLELVIGKGIVGKKADISMTLDVLRFISKIGNRNITKFVLSEIKEGNTHEIFSNLQKRNSPNGIYSIGPKISSFYLRDLVSLFDYDKYLKEEDFIFLQPIDTWVRQVVNKMGLIEYINESDEIIRTTIVRECKKYGLSSLKFNQGAWFLGYKSFDIVLRNIEKIE